jgi:hypothetical protein
VPTKTKIRTIIATKMTLKFSALRVDVDLEGSDSSALIQGRGTLRRVRPSQQKLLGSILLAEEFRFSTAILHRKDARMAAIGCNPGMVASKWECRAIWSAKCGKLALQRDQAFDKCAERNAGGQKYGVAGGWTACSLPRRARKSQKRGVGTMELEKLRFGWGVGQ